MKLRDALDRLEHCQLIGDPDGEVLGLTHDSRQVQPGWIFAALQGEHEDGRRFIPRALEAGASAILSANHPPPSADQTWILADDPRKTMAELAQQLHGHPDEALVLIGVTGTNGKTTTTMLIRQLLKASSIGCGLVGTVLNAAGNHEEEAGRTTPESPDFYRWLARSRDAGDAVLAAEVSSHALCLNRVKGAHFRVGVFTNLTQDHLDFHRDLENYFKAKCTLFEMSDQAVINIDDAYGRRLADALSRHNQSIAPFGCSSSAEYRIVTDSLALTPTGSRFELQTPKGNWIIHSPLLGRFNIYNLTAALVALDQAGFPIPSLLSAISALRGAPGRLERVDLGQPFGVLVDYAHTPDALEKLLTAGRDLLPIGGRLHVLFGCGGDRDRSKRPLMAAAVARGADVLWHTSDNTRTEDPDQILDDAAAGLPDSMLGQPHQYHRIPDRAWAVQAAVEDCRPGDLLLLAGKGHEPYQDIQGVKYPYSDRIAVECALKQKPIPRPWAMDHSS